MKHYGIDIAENAMGAPFVEFGTKAWMSFRAWRHHSFVVPVTINEIDLVLQSKDKTKSRWWYLFSEHYVLGENSPPENLDEWEIVNQFVSVDEPIGHSVWMNEPYDGVFMTKQGALNNCSPWKGARKCHVRKALRSYRNGIWGFIASTHNGLHPGIPHQEDKQVFVRRK